MLASEKPGQHHAAPNIRLLGSYRILGLIGEGGMSWVYEAEHVKLGRRVALKRLKPPYGQQAASVQAFFEEARAANRIRHPGMVQITDFVPDPGGAYIVMERLRGQTLADALAGQVALSPLRCLDIAFQAADALAAAHLAGIVHRDIKPTNLFLVDDPQRHDRVKLLDFGVAQLEVSARSSGETVALGQAVGTPAYMSPEQANDRPVDGRADLYSMGVVLFEMLSGKRPFDGATRMALVYQHTSVAPPPLPPQVGGSPLPGGLAAMVERCLRKSPEDRYETAEALCQALKDQAADVGALLRLDSAPMATASRPRRFGVKLIRELGALVGLAALALGVLWVVVRWVGSSEGESTAQRTSGHGSATSRAGAHAHRGQVSLRILSSPEGGRVERIAPDPEVLGVSPLSLTIPPDGRAWRIRVTAPGHLPREEELRPDRDQELVLELEPEGAPRQKAETERPRVRAPAGAGALEPPSEPATASHDRSVDTRPDRRRRPGMLPPGMTRPGAEEARHRPEPRRDPQKPRGDVGTINPFQ